MKTTLCMAMSLDWYVADRNWGTPWTEEDWDNYCQLVAESDVLVIWRITYDEMMLDWDLDDFPDTPICILSTEDTVNHWNHIFLQNYGELESICHEKWYTNIMIAWWAQINSLFLEQWNIDELYIDIEPHIFGDGLKLFDNISKNYSMALISSKHYWENSIQLHYVLEK